MSSIGQWYLFLVFFSGGLGLLVSVILFFFTHNDSFHSRLLAGFLACMSLLSLNYGLMKTNFFIHFPLLWRGLAWASFCFQPLGYLYVRSTLKQQYRLRHRDLLLFLPALIHMLCYMPYFRMTLDGKKDFLGRVFADQNMIVLELESLLPPQVGIWARILLGVCCTIGQWKLLQQWKRIQAASVHPGYHNDVSITWLTHFTTVVSIFWLAVLTEFSLHFSELRSGNIDYVVIFTISGTISFICLYLLIRPRILYGLTGWLQSYPIPDREDQSEEPLQMAHSEGNGEVRRALSISLEQREEYRQKIQEHFLNDKPFRRKGYTIGQLSAELGIPTYVLSIFINQEYGKNFNEFVNEKRVYHIIEETQLNAQFNSYTLEALGNFAGFNSRTAFINAVKKVTGKTPSEVFGRRVADAE